MQSQARIDKAAVDCQLKIRKRLRTLTATLARPTEPKESETTATKLPKLELPALHGDILCWKNFWEQLCPGSRSIYHSQRRKLMYLQNAIKNKSTKSLITGHEIEWTLQQSHQVSPGKIWSPMTNPSNACASYCWSYSLEGWHRKGDTRPTGPRSTTSESTQVAMPQAISSLHNFFVGDETRLHHNVQVAKA